jgi:hypothetical protein
MMDQHDALDLAQSQASAEIALHFLQQKYFSEIEPVSRVEVVDDPSTASCYLPQLKTIRLNSSVARFPKLAQFLILHELIHHKLSLQNPDYAKQPYGEPFQRETRELFKLGAYDKLL